MLFKSSLAIVAASLSLATAQRPENTSICDYYAGALFGASNETTQYTLLTALVNRAVIGNTSATTAGIAVPGILNPNGTYNGTAVNLVPYFSGGLKSTNRGGNEGVSVNFLDGGGATPLISGMPANDTSSNQYTLLTHLYQFFGALLGCSASDYPTYEGDASMYEVHKFMVLDVNEMSYFITQVGLSAASFGAASSDVQAAGSALNSLFNNRCGANTTVIPSQGAALQSCCTASDCPLASGADSSCPNQAAIAAPQQANGTSTSGGASSSGAAGASGSRTSSGPAASGSAGTGSGGSSGGSTGHAVRDIVSVAGLLSAVGFGAFLLL